MRKCKSKTFLNLWSKIILLRTIMSNNLAKRVTELETKIKDYGLERQKVFFSR